MIYIKTLSQYFLILFIILIINFILPRLAPGDPAIYLVGEDIQFMTESERQQILSEFGLDLPLPIQFKNYIFGIFKREMGISIIYGQPVWDVIIYRLPWTLLVMGVALFFSASIGTLIGVIGAWKRGCGHDIGALIVVMSLGSIPPFWIAMLLITFFSAKLGWLPSFGAYEVGTNPGTIQYFYSVIRRLILPVLTLTLVKNTGQCF